MATTPSHFQDAAESLTNSWWEADQWEVRTEESSYVLDVRALKDALSDADENALHTLFLDASVAGREGRGEEAQALQGQLHQSLLSFVAAHPEVVASERSNVPERSTFDIAVSHLNEWWGEEEWTAGAPDGSLVMDVQAVKAALSDAEEVTLQTLFLNTEVAWLEDRLDQAIALDDQLRQQLETIAQNHPQVVSPDVAAAIQTTMGV